MSVLNPENVNKILGAKSLLISTGNIINLSELRRKTTQDVTDELTESLALTLVHCAKHPTDIAETTELVTCRASGLDGKTEPRKDLKFTVKIFMQSDKTEVLVDAFTSVLHELETDFVELVILAFPHSDGVSLPDEVVRPLWNLLESYVDQKKIVSIGVSDLDTEQLIRLHEWARIKPSVNHVNLSSCCVMPAEMTAFAKINDIQLLTHNDPRELVPSSHIPAVFQKVSGSSDQQTWKMNWVSRYSAMIKGRGVIQKKGFVASLRKQQKS